MNTDREKSAVGAATPATENIENVHTNIINRAVEKVKTPINSKDRYAKVIAEPVSQALQDFCRQVEEFARAVLDGGTVEECVNDVAKKINGKTSVSDLDVYQMAVEYYFPGAVIRCRMTVHMSEYDLAEPEPTAAEPSPTPKKSIDLSLDSLLDW